MPRNLCMERHSESCLLLCLLTTLPLKADAGLVGLFLSTHVYVAVVLVEYHVYSIVENHRFTDYNTVWFRSRLVTYRV